MAGVEHADGHTRRRIGLQNRDQRAATQRFFNKESWQQCNASSFFGSIADELAVVDRHWTMHVDRARSPVDQEFPACLLSPAVEEAIVIEQVLWCEPPTTARICWNNGGLSWKRGPITFFPSGDVQPVTILGGRSSLSELHWQCCRLRLKVVRIEEPESRGRAQTIGDEGRRCGHRGQPSLSALHCDSADVHSRPRLCKNVRARLRASEPSRSLGSETERLV